MRLALPLAVALAALPLLPGSALATAGMVCDGLGDAKASVEMNLPRSAGSPPNWVRIDAGGKFYSSLSIDEGAAPIAIRQSFEDGDTFRIDLTDDSYADAIIRIRLFRAEEGDAMPVYVGYVHVVGDDVYPITCTEDE
jgi:hypothetical protein